VQYDALMQQGRADDRRRPRGTVAILVAGFLAVAGFVNAVAFMAVSGEPTLVRRSAGSEAAQGVASAGLLQAVQPESTTPPTATSTVVATPLAPLRTVLPTGVTPGGVGGPPGTGPAPAGERLRAALERALDAVPFFD
jgi:hypothetical protein